MTPEAKPATPGVRFPPPFLFAGGLALAWLLESRVLRLRFIGGDDSRLPLEIAGVFLIAIGLLLMGWALLTFMKARTAILPMRPASRLVEHGPFRISRNPMYTGMALFYLGVMLAMNWVWALVMFPVVIVLLYQLVISREERYLLGEFGDEYRSYCRRVRRWI